MVQNVTSSNAAHAIFVADLAKWGPDQPPSACDLAFAQQHCRLIARSHYENFTVVTWFLPRELRQDFYNFYAYCRWSDDIADEVEPDRRLGLLDWWQQQLALCYSGRPAHPVMVALRDTIQRHQVPIEPLTDLLSAFRQDQSVTRYASHEELLRYCQRSANPVGRVILRFGRADREANVELSDAICTGLQIANFCQDMARDAAIDRIYAPRDLWHRHGVDEAMILRATRTDELQSMLREWVQTAETLFRQGMPLVKSVPSWLAVDVDLFVRGGLEILKQIERAKFDVWTSRPTVSKLSKLKLLARALTSRFGRI